MQEFDLDSDTFTNQTSSNINTIQCILCQVAKSYIEIAVPSRCDVCLTFLTKDKDIAIEESRLIKIMDRGSLKWPSNTVVESIIIEETLKFVPKVSFISISYLPYQIHHYATENQ